MPRKDLVREKNTKIIRDLKAKALELIEAQQVTTVRTTNFTSLLLPEDSKLTEKVEEAKMVQWMNTCVYSEAVLLMCMHTCA